LPYGSRGKLPSLSQAGGQVSRGDGMADLERAVRPLLAFEHPHGLEFVRHVAERVACEFGVDVPRPEARIIFELGGRWLRPGCCCLSASA
jgi:hypothetical protein